MRESEHRSSLPTDLLALVLSINAVSLCCRKFTYAGFTKSMDMSSYTFLFALCRFLAFYIRPKIRVMVQHGIDHEESPGEGTIKPNSGSQVVFDAYVEQERLSSSIKSGTGGKPAYGNEGTKVRLRIQHSKRSEKVAGFG